MSQALIKFLSDFSSIDNEKKLFTEIIGFLNNVNGIRNYSILSVPKKSELIKISHFRVLIGDDKKSSFLNDYKDEIQKNYKILQEQNVLNVDAKNKVYLVNLGPKKSQIYIGLFSLEKDIDIFHLEALSLFSKSHLKTIENISKLYKTQELIHIDDVTGLYNQRKLYKDLGHLVDKYKNDNDPFCVLFIDIDHFKKVNDNHGHLVGTRLLEAIAMDLKHLLRESDLSYRYGGDEFVVILVNSDATAGKIVGERILQKITSKDYSVEIKDQQTKHALSVSIGIAEFPTDASNSQEILAIADRMMYEAKESGRGMVFNTQDVFKSSLKKVINNKF